MWRFRALRPHPAWLSCISHMTMCYLYVCIDCLIQKRNQKGLLHTVFMIPVGVKEKKKRHKPELSINSTETHGE